jgi:hypothetical protein
MSGRVLSVVDLMRGRFARFFPVTTWRLWIALAAVIFGLGYGLSVEDQEAVLVLMGRTVLPAEAAREVFIVLGGGLANRGLQAGLRSTSHASGTIAGSSDPASAAPS